MNKLIFLVDDDIILRNQIGNFLEQQGYSVELMENGRECINKVIQKKPDLIIIDYFMPELDGITTIKKIKNICKSPIIMISSNDIQENGFVFLRKPFKIQQLIDLINNLMLVKY